MKEIVKIFIGVLFVALNVSAYGQIKSYQFEEIDSLQKQNAKPVFVFVSTNWCNHCNAMKSVVFKDKKITKLLNQYFYFIWLNAEEDRKINFNKRHFNFKPTGVNTGIHQLAVELATINNQVVYPTFCVLNVKNEIIYQKPDFTNGKELEIILLNIIKNQIN
jgi:thioredoxin-related protein